MHPKILIVEDNSKDRQLLRYLLEEQFRSEAKFREADTIATAFKYLESGNIDFVVLDLNLPDSAGKETFTRLHDRFPDVPIIVMTHNKDRNLALEMIKLGAADYVLKDYTNADDIFRRIILSLEKHRRTVRVSPEKAASVHQLERAKANMMTAHQSGEHMAIQSTTVATTSALADIASKTFTEIQKLTNLDTQRNNREEQISKSLETLETEILKGTGTRPSMRSQVDVLEHRIGQVEKRLSDFQELNDRKEDHERLSAVHIQKEHMSNRTKILLGVLGLLGVIASAVASYEAARQNKDNPPAHSGGK